jgi:hypothetical protein
LPDYPAPDAAGGHPISGQDSVCWLARSNGFIGVEAEAGEHFVLSTSDGWADKVAAIARISMSPWRVLAKGHPTSQRIEAPTARIFAYASGIGISPILVVYRGDLRSCVRVLLP